MLPSSGRLRASLIVLLVLGLLALPASAGARPATPELIDAADERGRLGDHTANLYRAYAFGSPGKLPAAYRSDTPWDGTLVLLKLRRELRGMPRGRARERLEETLSASVAGASCGGRGSDFENSASSTHFFVHHDAIGGGLAISDYVTSLETSWSKQVTSFGWAAPPPLASPPPAPIGTKYYVRVEPLGGGLYGFVSNTGTGAGFVGDNPSTTWDEGDAYASCMVLNSDYTGFPSTPQAALDSTTAHEFNHSIQFGYGAMTGANVPDEVFFEGGATWMEDEVFDGANDNYNYLWPAFEDSLGEYDQSPYAYWITFRGLTERYGSGVAGGAEDVMQEFWESTSRNSASNLTAMQAGLALEEGDLADGFHAYAIAVKFNRGCAGGYAYPYCFEEGPAYVSSAGLTPLDGSISATPGSATHSIEDNYSLGWIALPASGTYNVTLENSSSGGSLRGTVACDTGSALALFPLPAPVGPAAATQLADFSPSAASCSSAPVAVVTNQAQQAPNPSAVQSPLRPYRVSASAGRLLSVSRTGSGGGTVTSSPAGIACGPDCFESYPSGTTVTLSAAPAPGSTFAGWSGDCAGTGECTLSMTAARSVAATFDGTGSDTGVVTGEGGGAGAGGGSLIDVIAPRLTSLRFSARRFRAARSGPSASVRTGARVAFAVNEAGTVGFRARRALKGRKVGASCRRPTRANRLRRACTRWVRVRGAFKRTAVPGTNRFRFRGRMGGRRLAPGGYRLIAAARDSAGNRAASRRAPFRIVR